MKSFCVRVFVGPTQVGIMAEKFRQAGLKVTCEGTSHVYCVLDTESDPRTDLLNRLQTKHNTTFGQTWRDVEVVRENVHVSEACY